MSISATSIHKQLIEEIHFRIYEESIPRIKKCLDLIDENQLWYSPNKNTNSIGNQILHIIGNMTQYIMYGIGQKPDVRKRSQEFIPSQSFNKAELLEEINTLVKSTSLEIKKINPTQLLSVRRVQVFDMSVLQILIHVTEHLSYHVGQITYITKMLLNTDTGYYQGQELG